METPTLPPSFVCPSAVILVLFNCPASRVQFHPAGSSISKFYNPFPVPRKESLRNRSCASVDIRSVSSLPTAIPATRANVNAVMLPSSSKGHRCRFGVYHGRHGLPIPRWLLLLERCAAPVSHQSRVPGNPEPHRQVAGRKKVSLWDAHKRLQTLLVAFCPARHVAGSFANRQRYPPPESCQQGRRLLPRPWP
jgi:hypothetical protein